MSENKFGILKRAAEMPKRKYSAFKEKLLDFKALSTAEKLSKTKR